MSPSFWFVLYCLLLANVEQSLKKSLSNKTRDSTLSSNVLNVQKFIQFFLELWGQILCTNIAQVNWPVVMTQNSNLQTIVYSNPALVFLFGALSIFINHCYSTLILFSFLFRKEQYITKMKSNKLSSNWSSSFRSLTHHQKTYPQKMQPQFWLMLLLKRLL